MAFKPEIKVVRDPKFYRNGLVFATEEEAQASARNTFNNWMAAEAYRTVEVDESVNARWDNEEGVIHLDTE